MIFFFFVFLAIRTTTKISTHLSLLIATANKVSILSTSGSIQSSRYSYGSSYGRLPVDFSLTVDLTWFLHTCPFHFSISSKNPFILLNVWKSSLLRFFFNSSIWENFPLKNALNLNYSAFLKSRVFDAQKIIGYISVIQIQDVILNCLLQYYDIELNIFPSLK